LNAGRANQICLDQRYTNNQLRFELEKQIREEIVDLPQKVVLLRQLNSQANVACKQLILSPGHFSRSMKKVTADLWMC
jgi:uncharacterized FAD-dependent dehydrogenase